MFQLLVTKPTWHPVLVFPTFPELVWVSFWLFLLSFWRHYVCFVIWSFRLWERVLGLNCNLLRICCWPTTFPFHCIDFWPANKQEKMLTKVHTSKAIFISLLRAIKNLANYFIISALISSIVKFHLIQSFDKLFCFFLPVQNLLHFRIAHSLDLRKCGREIRLTGRAHRVTGWWIIARHFQAKLIKNKNSWNKEQIFVFSHNDFYISHLFP